MSRGSPALHGQPADLPNGRGNFFPSPVALHGTDDFSVHQSKSFLLNILSEITKDTSHASMPKEMPPNNLRKPVAKFTDFIRFTLNKMRRLFSGSS